MKFRTFITKYILLQFLLIKNNRLIIDLLFPYLYIDSCGTSPSKIFGKLHRANLNLKIKVKFSELFINLCGVSQRCVLKACQKNRIKSIHRKTAAMLICKLNMKLLLAKFEFLKL